MRTGQPSSTARDNALVRALDARRAPNARVAGDALAVHFLPAGYRALVELARVPLLRRAIEAVIDARWPGPRRGVVARTRRIDELLARSLPDVGQVLLLGAGFDTRAYRLPGINRVPVFEVDHPATQAAKRAALERQLGAVPAHVHLVAVDFACDDLAASLADAGFASPASTFVLWEGVTNYLDAAAVDATFAFVRAAADRGSPVVFTYVDRRIIDDPTTFAGARASTRRVRRQHEPFTFGLHPDEIAAFLSDRGLELLEDVAAPELVARYYGESMDAYAYYHVVHAVRR